MGRALPHDPLLTHLAAPRLKLGLDEADHPAATAQQLRRHGQHELQGDEGHIDAREIDGVGHLFAGDIADVGALQVDDPSVGPQLPGELAVADVDRVDLFGAVLQHAVGEAAGRRADIHAGFPLEHDRKDPHRLFELEAAPADVPEGLPAHLERGGLLHVHARLVGLLAVDIHLPRHDDRLRLFSAREEPALHQQDIQSFFHVVLRQVRSRVPKSRAQPCARRARSA